MTRCRGQSPHSWRRRDGIQVQSIQRTEAQVRPRRIGVQHRAFGLSNVQQELLRLARADDYHVLNRIVARGDVTGVREDLLHRARVRIGRAEDLDRAGEVGRHEEVVGNCKTLRCAAALVLCSALKTDL
jgi:hypothetical protein